MERLLRRMEAAYSDTSPTCWPIWRTGSPSGGSILITSAPKSASSRVQAGPAMVVQISMTFSPASGPVGRSGVHGFSWGWGRPS
jgi:hypothetical protein